MGTAPEIVDGQSGGNQREAGEALARIDGQLVQDDGKTDQREDDRHDREPPGAKRRPVAV
jgi:hypothetical protein